jgi:integrase
MSDLRHYSEEYLTLRRALGYKLVGEGQLLARFVTFAEEAGAVTVTTELAVAWTRLATEAGQAYLARRMRVVRSFACYLFALDPRTEVPSAELFPARKYRPTPHIYEESEVTALMVAARALVPSLRAATFETLIGLLAATGLRIGEAMALDRDDVDWSGAALMVRDSKYNKSREVLVHPSTVVALKAYAKQRDRLSPHPSAPSFFVTTRGSRLLHTSVEPTFRRLVADVGLVSGSSSRTPRWHDLRHTFAVNTLLSWYRDGGDVAARIPLLSTYLGHIDPKATYWYLSAVPELLSLAAERLEHDGGERA